MRVWVLVVDDTDEFHISVHRTEKAAQDALLELYPEYDGHLADITSDKIVELKQCEVQP